MEITDAVLGKALFQTKDAFYCAFNTHYIFSIFHIHIKNNLKSDLYANMWVLIIT